MFIIKSVHLVSVQSWTPLAVFVHGRSESSKTVPAESIAKKNAKGGHASYDPVQMYTAVILPWQNNVLGLTMFLKRKLRFVSSF